MRNSMHTDSLYVKYIVNDLISKGDIPEACASNCEFMSHVSRIYNNILKDVNETYTDEDIRHSMIDDQFRYAVVSLSYQW